MLKNLDETIPNNSLHIYQNSSNPFRISLGVKGLIFQNQRFLVLVKPNGELDTGGGRVKPGEHPLKALHREIYEETNLKVRIHGPPYPWSFYKNANHLISGQTYLCLPISNKIRISNEHIGFFWADFTEASDLHFNRSYGLDTLIKEMS